MKALERQVADWPVRRAAVAVVTADETATIGADDEAFALASITKLYTAYATLIAVEEGTLDLALDLRDITPLRAERGPVRLDDVLAHAAGLAPDRLEQIAVPRQRRIYSTAGYDLVAEVLAQRSALSFGDYVREGVLEPLAMARTVIPRGGTGGFAPVRDVAALARELLCPTLISAETAARQRAVHLPGLAGVLPGYGSHPDNCWGLGPEIRGVKQPHWTATRNSPATFGHFGQAGGFVWIDPAAGVGLIALSDREFGPWAVDAWPRLGDAVLEHCA